MLRCESAPAVMRVSGRIVRRPGRVPASVVLLLVLALLGASPHRAARADPLASWRDGRTKAAIVEFVTRVTTPGGAEFVPASERIATFDNDGTLWPERPLIQGLFALGRLRTMATADPALRSRQPYMAAL